MEYTLYFIDRNGDEQELDLDISYSISNDGIGPYEYWGQKGVDKGHDCVEIEEIFYNKKNLTKEELENIEQSIKENIDRISEACFKDAESAKENYEEREFDLWKEEL